MKVVGYGHSVVGGRENNQDSFLVDNDKLVFAVADGVGGGLRGEDASRMAVEGLEAEYKTGEALQPIVEKLAERVLQEALASCGGEALMGTTLTSVAIVGDYLKLCQVGDSRAYLYEGEVLKQLTEDHESFDENINGPVLSSYLGLDTRVYPLKVQNETVELKAGQRFLLCSDGLYKQLTEMQIVDMIRHYGANPQELLQRLCEEASKVQYSDNITIVYLVVE